MRLTLFLFALVTLSAPAVSRGDDELTRIKQFVVSYTGDASAEFSTRMEKSFGGGKQTLENLVAVLLLYEKVAGEDGAAVMRDRLRVNVSHFSTVLYPNQVARLALLDFGLGTAETTEMVRKLSEALRSNTRVSRAFTTVPSQFGTQRIQIRRLIKALTDAATSDPNFEVEPTLTRLLSEQGLTRKATETNPSFRSHLVTVSDAEVRDRIAAVAAGALRPSTSAFSVLPEVDLRRLLLDESIAVRKSALNALCDGALSEVDSIAALLSVHAAEWVDSPERERIDRALERSLPLAVRSRLSGTNSVEFARCLLELLLPK